MRTPEEHHLGRGAGGHMHDTSEAVAGALSTSAQGVRATWISLGGLAATAFVQLAIVFVSGSVALLADTIHNFTDALTAIPLLIAFRLGRRPPNRRYTYGYHRAEDLAGIAIVLMIAASAVATALEAANHLVHPQAIEHATLVLGAGMVGFLGNEAVAHYRIRVGRRIGSAALVADGVHARTDGLTSLGVVVSAVAALAGAIRVDAAVGLAIAIVIGWTLWATARQVLRRMLDGIDEPTIALIEEAAAAVPGVEHVTEARARWAGHQLRAELSIDVEGTLSVEAGHDIADGVRDALLHAVPRLADAVVHVEPHDHDPH
ncbi:MAG TPA: cation diffusion facilitator family transporter [Actinomycetota bacterium]|jgi:cation diffusion facilitator family transporter|nr:cation diffusion facilitator family transporter [Actinomycetota bacterium]